MTINMNKRQRREIPILFSKPMIQAILAGRKVVTRRLIKWPDTPAWHDWDYDPNTVERRKGGEWWPQYAHRNSVRDEGGPVKCPYGQPGDILWVRENLFQEGELGLKYDAGFEDWIDEDIIPSDYGPYGGTYKYRTIPNIHMPKWAARIWLQVEEIRVERLHDISEEDAIAEGIEPFGAGYRVYTVEGGSTNSPIGSFSTLWESINGMESCKANPWVWVVKFKVLSTEGRPNLPALN